MCHLTEGGNMWVNEIEIGQILNAVSEDGSIEIFLGVEFIQQMTTQHMFNPFDLGAVTCFTLHNKSQDLPIPVNIV